MKLDGQESLAVAQLPISAVDDQDNIADDERARLHTALDRSLKDAAAGRLHRAEYFSTSYAHAIVCVFASRSQRGLAKIFSRWTSGERRSPEART